MVLLRPLDGGSYHLQIQKEGCGRARGPPALRKLGQSRLVTSPLMEAASSVWIFLYCRRWCRETSWFPVLKLAHFSTNSGLKSVFISQGEVLESVPPSLGTGLSPPPSAPQYSQPHAWSALLVLPLTLNLVLQALMSAYSQGHCKCTRP